MDLLLQRIFDGFTTGAIYAAVAVALVLIFKATTLINFAQGELAMGGAFVGYIFAVRSDVLDFISEEDSFTKTWVAAILAMIISAIVAMAVERALVRPFDPDDHLPVVLITLGLFLIINAVVGEVFNYQAQNPPMPGLFPNDFDDFWRIGGVTDADGDISGGARLFWDAAGIVLSLAAMLFFLYLLLNRTKMGLAFRAVSSNVESARLVGVRTGRVLGFGWALAAAFGTLGAMLVAPRLSLQPNMMAVVLIYALAGAAIGGLDSLGGAAVGGLIIGLVNSVGVGYISDWEPFEFLRAIPLLLSLVAMLLTLLYRPSGLFGTKRVERV